MATFATGEKWPSSRVQEELRKHEIAHVQKEPPVKPSQVPLIMEIRNQVWFSMGLLLLLTFLWKVTCMTAETYGPLPAAVVFGLLTLVVIYAIHFATSRVQRT